MPLETDEYGSIAHRQATSMIISTKSRSGRTFGTVAIEQRSVGRAAPHRDRHCLVSCARTQADRRFCAPSRPSAWPPAALFSAAGGSRSVDRRLSLERDRCSLPIMSSPRDAFEPPKGGVKRSGPTARRQLKMPFARCPASCGEQTESMGCEP